MAGSLNKVQLIGHLGADPEIRSFPNGGKIAQMRIATSESWKDKQTGERKERTEWHTVQVLAEGLVGVVERYLRKGSKVFVEGQLRTRKWQDKDGNDRYSTEVTLQGYGAGLVLLDRQEGGDRHDGQSGGNERRSGGGSQTERGSYSGQSSGGSYSGGYADDLDDDIPF